MTDNRREKLLEKLTAQYKQAANNQNVTKTQIRALYFELNCLRDELEKMSEEEFALVDEQYNELTSREI